MSEKLTLSDVELNWIIMALTHDIVAIKEEIASSDADLASWLGENAIDNRDRLITKLTDMKLSGAKHITLTH